MADHLTLDVIDRPHGGTLKAVKHLRDVRRAGAPGLRALLVLGTNHFVTRRPLLAATPRRVATLAVWEGAAAVAAAWDKTIGTVADPSREHWHVHGELARASFSEPWNGWDPDVVDARKLSDDEPALILIAGDLRARYVRAFLRDAVKAVAHAFDQPGYLGGLGVASSPLNTTSVSAWRTYADAKEYAFKPGAHATAMKRDRDNEHHSTEWFIRLRPLAERGTLAGRAPFGELLRSPVAA
jgi:hypothetical protein